MAMRREIILLQADFPLQQEAEALALSAEADMSQQAPLSLTATGLVSAACNEPASAKVETVRARISFFMGV
jgi:hypothetical protein